MAKPAKILLQTTIPYAADDWHVGRFTLLADFLRRQTDDDGETLFEVVARNRDPLGKPDSVLSKLDVSDFDELWLFAVDTGDGLTKEDCAAIGRFRARGGGMMVTRDHMDLGSSVCTLGGVGLAHHFHTKNPEPEPERRQPDDRDTKDISWPNYHSGANGDYQEIAALHPHHPVLFDPESKTGIVRYLPAHPHEGAVSSPPEDLTARVIATGTSSATGVAFNIAVAFERTDDAGSAIAQSTFHHFADYNWDPSRGCPSFVTEKPGRGLKDNPDAMRSTETYVRNIALWLAGRSEDEALKQHLDEELDEAGKESFPASDPPAVGRPQPG